MAKNKKKDEYLKKKNNSDIRNKSYDFGFYAKEYKKLLEKKFLILLDNGEVFSISFEEGNFFHLLGFHKFENTIFYSMINDDTINYTQQNFFEDVYNENIWYDGFDENKIQIPEKFKENTLTYTFKEHELNDKTRHTLEDRFPFFSYENILKILKNKIVIDFEEEDSKYKVRASKILFYYLNEKRRNLNIFVDGIKDCYVTSFYLESKKDIYKNKIDGTPMNTFDVLCLYIEDAQNHQGIEFSPDWVKVRNLTSNNDIYNEMKALLKKGPICTKLLENEQKQIIKKINEIKIELKNLQKEKEILQLEELYYFNKENENDYILKLMDYDIDIEEQIVNIKQIEKEKNKICTKILDDNKLLTRLQNKEQKISLTTNDIEDLDISVIKKVYLPFIKNSKYWKEEFWFYFIHNYEYQKENIQPRQLKNLYLEWMKKKTT